MEKRAVATRVKCVSLLSFFFHANIYLDLSKSWFHSPPIPQEIYFLLYQDKYILCTMKFHFFLIKRWSARQCYIKLRYIALSQLLDDHITNQCTCKTDPVTKLVSYKMVEF